MTIVLRFGQFMSSIDTPMPDLYRPIYIPKPSPPLKMTLGSDDSAKYPEIEPLKRMRFIFMRRIDANTFEYIYDGEE